MGVPWKDSLLYSIKIRLLFNDSLFDEKNNKNVIYLYLKHVKYKFKRKTSMLERIITIPLTGNA